jgi:peptidoglycan/xylan/chitin deacetylase (PgdA/CDA1 family)
MTDAEQRAYIAASIEAVASATGSAPKGWLSQDQGEAPNTPALLADAGIHYLVDWSNDDQAYLMERTCVDPAPDRVGRYPPVLAAPRETWRYPDLIEEAARTLVEEGMISDATGLSIHPWLFGMAHRIRFLDEALTRLRAIDGLWQATTGEIATWARGPLEARK